MAEEDAPDDHPRAEPASEGPTLGRRALRSFLELLAVAGLAITQPVLDVFGRAPDRFLVRDASRADIVVFALVVALVPALVLWLIEWFVWSVSERARRTVHQVFLGGLVALLVAQVARRSFGTSGLLLIVAAAVIGGLAVLAYRKWLPVRSAVALLSAATVLYVGLFLLASPTAELVTAGSVETVDVNRLDSPRTVVILQFDEWPLASIVNGQGEIDAGLYPNLAALAGDGTWYRNATTVATDTSYALPAIVTGRYPDEEALPVASSYPESLFTLLGEEYRYEVQELVTQLCPLSLCPREDLTTSSGVSALLDDARNAFSVMVSPDPDRQVDPVGVDAGVTNTVPETGMFQGSNFGLVDAPVLELDSVERTVQGISAEEEPTLHFLHLLLPHQPYRFLPSGQAYDSDLAGLAGEDPLQAVVRPPDPAAMIPMQQRLILQAQYADQVVGRVMTRLREAGLYDEALVAVVADHGIGLEPGLPTRRIEHEADSEPLLPDVVAVPMIVKAPGLTAGEVSDRNVETIDLLPTIAESVGATLPWEVDGISLFDEGRSNDEKRLYIVDIPEGAVGGTGLLDEPVILDGQDLAAGVAARNVDTVLRADNPAYRAYAVSDAGELVGRDVATITAGPGSPWRATLTHPERLADVRPDSGVIPSRLVGAVDGPTDADSPTIAVALNGRIAAVVETHALDDVGHRFEAMLAPDVIVPGANQVALYVVTGTEGARVLENLAVG